MKPQNLKTQIIYGIVSGFIYASFIAIVDYFRDKDFNLEKFITGLVIFGIAMIIVAKIKRKKKN